MTQKGKEIPGLFDFPRDPTPSLKAYKQFTNHVYEYLAKFKYYEGVLAIGPINLGTPGNPIIAAPIEMDPDEIKFCLLQTRDILTNAIREAEESIYWTRKILDQISTKSSEAEERIQHVKKIVDDIKKLLDNHKGIAWHPGCYERIKNLVQSSFIRGEPGIAIHITIIV